MDFKKFHTYLFTFQDMQATPSKPTEETMESHTENVENAVDGMNNGNSPGVYILKLLSFTVNCLLFYLYSISIYQFTI